MTIKNYFLNDFQAISLDWEAQVQLINKNSGEVAIIDVKVKVVLQNDGSTRFIVFYVPETILTPAVCRDLILSYEETIEKANGVESIPGIRGDLSIGVHKSIYSRRIYFYTEVEINKAELELLNKTATEQELYITFRSSDYLKIKMETDKPLAFISHDSRDKELIARDIAKGLSLRLCSVWYDEYTLNIGDSLRDSIEKGIKEAKKCILILTPHFLNNPGWTKKEFDSIFTREMIFNEKLILPIWYNVNKKDIYEYSPALADTVALIWPDKENMDEEVYKKEVEFLISKIHTVLNKNNS